MFKDCPRSATRAIPSSSCEALESRITPAVIYAVTDAGQFIAFDSSDPSTYLVNEGISGLAAGYSIEGMDIRPATGELYALAVSNGPNVNDTSARLYKIDKQTGAATPVGVPFINTLPDNTRYGFDFNPTVDRIRVVNGADINFRVNPNDGTLLGPDSDLTSGSINAAAYDRNFPGASATTLFGIDFTNDRLVRIGGIDGEPSPNTGAVTEVGPLGVTLQSGTGFDIAPDGSAFLAGTTLNTDATRLYSVDLTTGAATNLGLIMETLGRIRGMTVEIPQVTISPDGRTATYEDTDGDLVTVKTSKGTFDSSDFVLFSAGNAGGAQLSRLLLSDDGQEFTGAKLTFTAKPAATGDGRVNVGWIDSTGFDLGAVNVNGDLGKITVGAGNADGLALASLKARSLGLYDTATQGIGADLVSEIKGNAGPLTIRGDARGASIEAQSGKVASLFIGGSFGVASPTTANGPHLFLSDVTGAFTIGRDIIGGETILAGYVSVKAKTVRVGGSITGGLGNVSGTLEVSSATSVLVGGDIRGDFQGGALTVGAAKTVKVAGSILGATNGRGGSAQVLSATSVVVGGSIIGGSIEGNASVNVGGALTVGNAKTVLVQGSVISGVDDSTGTLQASGLIAIDRVSALTIKGSLVGNATHPVRIVAGGDGGADPVFIKNLTIGGSVTWAEILAGWRKGFNVETVDGDGSIGSVKVGGDWTASSLVAGVNDVDDDGFGDADDVIIALGNDAAISSRIASITIKGAILGSSVPGDRFAFSAQEIGTISIGGKKLSLSPSETDFLALPSIQTDVFVREL